MKLRVGVLLAAVLGLPAAAGAADLPVKAPYVKAAPVPYWTWEVGGRYFGSAGRNRYDLRGGSTSSSPIFSALDYRSDGHAGEGFFRVDSPIGIFVKGFAGGGTISGGRLYDEDFPAAGFNPTSRTESRLRGNLSYATADVGYNFYDGRAAGSPVRLGGFVGYNYWHERYDAYGCIQVNPGGAVCVPPANLPTSVRVISEQDTFNSLRVGGVIDWWINPAWRFTGEAAYIHADQRAVDTHYFTFGRDPARGRGDGFQLEAILSYAVTPNFNVGVGARYWRLETVAHESFFNQRIEYTTERAGGFVQASYKFDTTR